MQKIIKWMIWQLKIELTIEQMEIRTHLVTYICCRALADLGVWKYIDL
jgi:hypothetical protein